MILGIGNRRQVANAISFVFVTAVAATAGIKQSKVFQSHSLNYRYLIPADKIAVEPELEFSTGGKKYEVMPRRIWIKPDLSEPTLRLKDIQPKIIQEILAKEVKITIDGEPYTVITGKPPTPRQALRMLPPSLLAKKISEIMADLQVTKLKAKEILTIVAKKEIQIAEEFKRKLVKEDEELALIIIMSEV